MQSRGGSDTLALPAGTRSVQEHEASVSSTTEGVAKLQTPNLEEGEAIGFRDGTIRQSVGQFLLALHIYYSSISTRLPEILDCSFQWGLLTPILGNGRPQGVGDGTVRKSVSGFL